MVGALSQILAGNGIDVRIFTSLYSTEDSDEPLRFAALCHSALLGCQSMRWSPDLIHCHDWQAAGGCYAQPVGVSGRYSRRLRREG